MPGRKRRAVRRSASYQFQRRAHSGGGGNLSSATVILQWSWEVFQDVNVPTFRTLYRFRKNGSHCRFRWFEAGAGTPLKRRRNQSSWSGRRLDPRPCMNGCASSPKTDVTAVCTGAFQLASVLAGKALYHASRIAWQLSGHDVKRGAICRKRSHLNRR